VHDTTGHCEENPGQPCSLQKIVYAVCQCCGKEVRSCPYCHRAVLAIEFQKDFPRCPECQGSLSRIRCHKCKKIVFEDFNFCLYCRTLMQKPCPHCEKLIKVAEFKEFKPCCPECQLSLKMVNCPYCQELIYEDLKSCPSCQSTLKMVVCRYDNCYDHQEKKSKFYQGLMACPRCGGELRQCPYCQAMISAFEFETENPKCPECKKSIYLIPCPHCQKDIALDLTECPNCQQPLEMIKCQHDYCLHPDGHRGWFYRGLTCCPFCDEDVNVCPHCNRVIWVDDYDYENGNTCPKCKKSIQKIPCPSCLKEIKQNLSQCPECQAELDLIQCPSSACLDLTSEVNKFYRGLNQCPFCERQL
jgi:hypothetical protein